MQDVNNKANLGGGEGISAQFFCILKTAPKKSLVIKKKTEGKIKTFPYKLKRQ